MKNFCQSKKKICGEVIVDHSVHGMSGGISSRKHNTSAIRFVTIRARGDETFLFCFVFSVFWCENALVKEQQLYQIWKENVEGQKSNGRLFLVTLI